MAFNYDSMRKLAQNLVSENQFGNIITLRKMGKKAIYNPITMKNEKSFEDFLGKGFMKTYSTEMIGDLSNIINAGDVEIICVLDDETVIPTEGVDKIIIEKHTYNILHVAMVNPNGKKVIIHKLHCRRAI